MKITLEASPLLHTLTGIGRYTWELATRLPAHDAVDVCNLLVRNEVVRDPYQIIQMSKAVKTFPLWSKPLRLTSRYLKKRHALEVCRNSLIHGPNYFLPPCAESGIITVHDLSIYHYPQTHPLERVQQFEKNFDATLRKTHHIITDSHAIKHEIMDMFGWNESKLSVIPLGVSSEFIPRHGVNEIFLHKYGIQAEGYSLCVATIEPRKNIDKLLFAYKLLPEKLRENFPLVLIGGIGWHSEEIMRQIEDAVRDGWVIRPGFVSEEALVLFYSHAKLFVYPSAYEGFGLPVVEAMACGIPVIISNGTSLPEVAAGVALVIDPDDQEAFVNELQRGLEDAQWQRETRINGIEKAKEYTWEKCVNETVAVYSSF